MRKKILFVDDDIDVLNGLQRNLHEQSKEWEMTFTTEPTEVSKLIRRQPIDVVVIDAQMPQKNGLMLLNEIKSNSRTKNIEVVILTGVQDESLKRQALNFGAADLLNKPVYKEDLVARIKSVLRLKAFHERLEAQNALLERQLIQAHKMEAIGLLAESVTYDFENILTVIRVHSNYTSRYLNVDTKTLESLKEINRACEHGKKIVQQISLFSKQVEQSPELCNLGEIIDNSLEMIKQTIPGNVKLEWKPPDYKYKIRAVSAQINQLLIILCINAVRSTSVGGLLQISLTETEMTKKTTSNGRKNESKTYLKLEISYTGKSSHPTIPKPDCDEPLDLTNTQEKPYIGLSVAQRIVKNHDGLISFENKNGNIFNVYLPYAKSKNTIKHE